MDELMRRVHETELEIMDVIHNVCIKNNLKYSIFYGTLLGAVRHGGFIPWDDDIDIVMPRNDYEKLIETWDSQAPSQFLLQTYESEEDYNNNFAKIRKDKTAFIQSVGEKTKKYHKGIFVDIFPGDRISNSIIGRKVQYIACAIHLLYSRGYKSGEKGVYSLIEGALLNTKKSNYKKRYIAVENHIIKRWNSLENQQYIFASTIVDSRICYPADIFENLQLIPFEDRYYYAVQDADQCLRISYGDYMKLPPENERIWKHHPLIVDFEHNYEDL